MEVVKIFIAIMPVVIGALSFGLVVEVIRAVHAGRSSPGKNVGKKFLREKKNNKVLTVLFALVMVVAGMPRRQKVIRVYERINSQLRERKGFFNYAKIEKFLASNGAAFHYGAKINTGRFMIYRLIAAAVGFMLGIQLHTVFSVIAAVLGFQAPVFMLIYLNTKDNQRMLPEIQTVYNTLQVQIRSGVHITNALADCYRGLERGRLRNNLEELTNEIYIIKSMQTAVNHFNEKFNNGFIDTLCGIIIQAQESGQIVELLDDISEQIKDMQSAILIKRKEKLDRQITLYTLLLVSAVLAVILYACVTMMFQSAGNL